MIQVFTKPGCPHCENVKRWLSKREADFEVIDVTKDNEAYKLITETYGARVVPVVVTDEDVWINPDIRQVDEEVLGGES